MSHLDAIYSRKQGDAYHDAPTLFDADSYDAQPDYINPRVVPCPTCGALAGRRCKRPSGHRPMLAHQDRIAQARFAAGAADQPAPSLLDRSEFTTSTGARFEARNMYGRPVRLIGA